MELTQLSMRELAQKLSTGEVSSVEATKASLERIHQVDGKVKAFLTVDEKGALAAAEALRRSVALKAEVRRDGAYTTIPVENVVPGDLIRVRAGDIIPADALVIESNAFTAAEAALTGEPYPVEKRSGTVTAADPAEASISCWSPPRRAAGWDRDCGGSQGTSSC